MCDGRAVRNSRATESPVERALGAEALFARFRDSIGIVQHAHIRTTTQPDQTHDQTHDQTTIKPRSNGEIVAKWGFSTGRPSGISPINDCLGTDRDERAPTYPASMSMSVQPISEPVVRAMFQRNPEDAPRAFLVAGACGNVGFGKLGQFARLLAPYGIPVVALDLSAAVNEIGPKLRAALEKRFSSEEIDRVVANITPVQGSLADVPSQFRLAFVFEAIPELLPIKHAFYRAVRQRDPEAFIFSATSGFTSRMLFEGLSGATRCGVMHPFFPHISNKLWELPTRDAVTGTAELASVKKLLEKLGMVLVEVRDVPSFAADRIFGAMMLEAVRIHESTGLTPAQVDHACKHWFGTSPFFVHNMISGGNYLSAHCMQLLRQEVDSTLYEIPAAWKPYIEDPAKQWPYERGQPCPAEHLDDVRDRMLGMFVSLTAYIAKHEIVAMDALNYLCEQALAFRDGVPAIMASMGSTRSQAIATAFIDRHGITRATEAAPLEVLSDDSDAWHSIYVGTFVRERVGVISLKRATLNETVLAELDTAYERLAADPSVDAIVLAPDGKFNREFGHGADVNRFVPVLGHRDAALELIRTWKRTLGKLRSGKPTVAALAGRVLGGSGELASCCHARIAAVGTKLGQPETTVGVIPGLGGCHHLHRFSQPAAYVRINELLLTGYTFSAEEAASWGYVTKVVPIGDLSRASVALASALAAGTIPLPSFRNEGSAIAVDRGVSPRNESGVVLDAELRELCATTIERANALPYDEASLFEEQQAATSLALGTSKIGVHALLKGKPPQFEHPLVR